MQKQGIKFLMNTKLESGVNNKETLEGKSGKSKVTSEVVLLSIGRKPFTGGL
jgi:pyruvate/2-oxoglutarate dehydrogenase complex dihydrolipoamide dehydrogenase (E3) component